MSLLIEQYVPVVAAQGGIVTALPVTINGNLTVTGTTTIAGISLTDLTVTGNTIIGNATSDTLTITGATSITSTSASALVVGRQGATDPVLKVVASTASVATGVSITGAAAAGGVAVAAISSGTNENLTLDAKGSGTITIGSVSTGAITISRATTINGAGTVNGPLGAAKGEALPAGGNANASITATSTASFGIYFGSGAPSVSAAKGSLYLRSDGSGVGDRAYINTDGAGTWTAITTVA